MVILKSKTVIMMTIEEAFQGSIICADLSVKDRGALPIQAGVAEDGCCGGGVLS